MPDTTLEPDWPAPPGVRALCTSRQGGVSRGSWRSFNLALHVGDETAAVHCNRERLAALLPPAVTMCWLQQVHGTRVVRAAAGAEPAADALWSDAATLACAILTADCLPVLFCSRDGRCVAAAHAGWRGLLGGVLEHTVAAMPVAPADLLVWLGPAIGPAAFEVGPEVRAAFVDAAGSRVRAATRAAFRAVSGRSGHCLADLYALARLRLNGAGVPLDAVSGGEFCTLSQPEQFFSYRRDGTTGRMASVICPARQPG